MGILSRTPPPPSRSQQSNEEAPEQPSPPMAGSVLDGIKDKTMEEVHIQVTPTSKEENNTSTEPPPLPQEQDNKQSSHGICELTFVVTEETPESRGDTELRAESSSVSLDNKNCHISEHCDKIELLLNAGKSLTRINKTNILKHLNEIKLIDNSIHSVFREPCDTPQISPPLEHDRFSLSPNSEIIEIKQILNNLESRLIEMNQQQASLINLETQIQEIKAQTSKPSREYILVSATPQAPGTTLISEPPEITNQTSNTSDYAYIPANQIPQVTHTLPERNNYSAPASITTTTSAEKLTPTWALPSHKIMTKETTTNKKHQAHLVHQTYAASATSKNPSGPSGPSGSSGQIITSIPTTTSKTSRTSATSRTATTYATAVTSITFDNTSATTSRINNTIKSKYLKNPTLKPQPPQAPINNTSHLSTKIRQQRTIPKIHHTNNRNDHNSQSTPHENPPQASTFNQENTGIPITKQQIILKGIPAHIIPSKLTQLILECNPLIAANVHNYGDIIFSHTKGNSRKPHLYNAVFDTTSNTFEAFIRTIKINLGSCLVHSEKYSPITQCYFCMGLGHLKNQCNQYMKVCSHCAQVGHLFQTCPHKNNPDKLKCFNCIINNIPSTVALPHGAASKRCPIIKSYSVNTHNYEYECNHE